MSELYGIEHEGVRWINVLPQEAPILKLNAAALDRVAGPLHMVVDIGAHVGFTSLLAAKRGAGKVLAFEPNYWSFARLVNNIELNKLESVSPVCAAVVGHSGDEDFGDLRMCPGSPGQSSLAYNDSVPLFGVCPLVTLSAVLQHVGNYVDYLKIDCEGGEYDLLNWMEKYAMRAVRVVHLELHDSADTRYFRDGMKPQEWARQHMQWLGFVDFGDGLWARSNMDVK